MTRRADPQTEYSERLHARKKTVGHFMRKERRVAMLRLATALLFVAMAWFSFGREIVAKPWLVLPAVIFVALLIVHDRTTRLRQRAQKAVEFYEDGLARIEDRWIGRGQPTELFRGESHLYAADLDIFGNASLFELLCTARTRSGEETLADW